MKAIERVSAKTCKGCRYYRNIGGQIKACHYLHDTNEVRGDSISSCTRKKIGAIRKDLML